MADGHYYMRRLVLTRSRRGVERGWKRLRETESDIDRKRFLRDSLIERQRESLREKPC